MKRPCMLALVVLAIDHLGLAVPNSGSSARSKFNVSTTSPAASSSTSPPFSTRGNASYDYIVVGGGTAGLVMAARLSEKKSSSVAVIEAGGYYEVDAPELRIPAYDALWTGKDPQDTNPKVDWGFVTTPQRGALNASIHYARGKTLGGSSARNYMGYLRGTKDSYAKWADKVGDQSYTFDELLPFFEKSLNFTPPNEGKRAANATPEYDASVLGNGSGPLSVTFSNYAQVVSSFVQKGLQQLGIQPMIGMNSGNLLGSSYVLETIHPSTQERDSSETAFLKPMVGNENLKVYHHTLGKKILFNSKKEAIGVVVNTDGQDYTLSAKREVIISAGVFQSPQLLMVSGIGPKETLSETNVPVIVDRPGVGQNMWDHVLMGPSYRVNVITASALSNPTFAAHATELYNTNSTGILTNPGGDFGAWEKLNSTSRANLSSQVLDSLDQFPPDWPHLEYLNIAGHLGNQNNFVRDSPTDGFNYDTVAVALQAPLSRGYVTINSSDMADPPIINPNWLTHPTDQALAVAGYKRVRELFQTEAMQEVVIGEEYFPGKNITTDADILSVIRKSVSTVYHASATCAMGRRMDPKAVVDTSAKVIGVGRLRVVDASIFPILPPGHPMATIYALAEKISAEILGGK